MSKALDVLLELKDCSDYWSEYFVPLGIHERIDDAIKELLAQPEHIADVGNMVEPVAWMWTRNYEGGGYTNMVFQMKCEADEYAKDSENLKYPDLVRPLYLDENQGENNDR